MTKNLQESTSYSTLPPKAWKWEKRHWLVVIGLACLMLWWITPSLKTSPWLQSMIGCLPAIGGLAFAADNILKLAQ